MSAHSNSLTFLSSPGARTKVATVSPSDGKEKEEDNIHLTAGFLGDELLRLVEEPLGGTNGKI